MRKQINKNEERMKTEANANRLANMQRKNQQNQEDIDRLTAEIPTLREKITGLDDHIAETKTLMKNVEAQYYNDTGALAIPAAQDPEVEKQEYVEDVDPLDDIDDLDSQLDNEIQRNDQEETEQLKGGIW